MHTYGSRLAEEFSKINGPPRLDFLRGKIYEKAFFQAFWLTIQSRCLDLRAWISLFNSVLEINRQAGVRPFAYKLFGYVHHILTSMSALPIQAEIYFFDPLCQYMEIAARSARYEMARAANKSNVENGSTKTAPIVLASGARILRSIFTQLTSPAVSVDQLEQVVEGLE